MDLTPRARIEQACARLGKSAVVGRCLALLAGGDEESDFIATLGGPHAVRLLDDGIPSGQRYWLRVWAARGLLWTGPGEDVEVLRAALTDDAWRVREMACKVVARHRIGDLLPDVASRESDPVPRVRAAALRAVVHIVEDGA